MTRRPRLPLSRFPLLSTRELADARAVTSRFWANHDSEVLGPEAYELDLHRALLGTLAITFVRCSSRIRAVPHGVSPDYRLFVPLVGSVEILADGHDLIARPAHPMLRGPATTLRFEASPTRCFIVDIPEEFLASASGERTGHRAWWGAAGNRIIHAVKQLATAANRSPTLMALQTLGAGVRRGRMPEAIQRLERSLVDLLAIDTTVSGKRGTQTGVARAPAGNTLDVDSLKKWLASQSHRRVRISELASHAGVSPRTIERAFLRTGCTPLEYLREVRLSLARDILIRAAAGTTVAQAAKDAGYSHLGRFSSEYRAHVGELPSQTLTRGRQGKGKG